MVDVNKLAYDIQMLRKQLTQSDVQVKKIQYGLYAVRKKLYQVAGGATIACRITPIIESCDRKGFDPIESRNLLQSILKSVQSLKVKQRIFNTRKEMAEMHYRPTNYCKTSDIHMYDVVMAPTEGGLHYSLVGDIVDDRMYCYPMTTTSKQNLKIIGRKHASMLDPIEGSRKVFLTDAQVCLTKQQAQEHFVKHTYPTSDMVKAMEYVKLYVA